MRVLSGAHAGYDSLPRTRVTRTARNGRPFSPTAGTDDDTGFGGRAPSGTGLMAAAGTGIHGVTLSRPAGDVRILRPGLTVAELILPGQPLQRITLPRRSLAECLAEELRRLDPDEIFGEVITQGLPRTNLRSVRRSER